MTLRMSAVVQVVSFVVVFALAGAVAGVAWQWLWTAPMGMTFEDKWYLEPAGPDYSFSGTGWYVVVALVAGAVTAFVLAWWRPRHELASLFAIAIGSVLAGWVMFRVGHALGPEDPSVLAVGTEDLTPIPSDLTLAGVDGTPMPFSFESSALAAFPIGAMFASIYVFLITQGRSSARSSPAFEQPPFG